ncbi:ArsR/SmtB family transcription factor [Hymenobacter ruricola]|uniref:Winged helix-turn-helix transcriptional regulator n=1 Tax=Hymenobacter ruricola TaxID=2791023 RepID=A0ABS0HY35_9BACT|nr:winged helix-turn-helix domain-containing protein [Hymenobacter ruricola]MBF9219612.1 winged helix-turn-helix transcriptional regulator [Hymenobacter ruricola]
MPTPPVAEDPEPAATSETALLAAFERRVLARDEPVPVPMDAGSLRARIRAGLAGRLPQPGRQRDRRRLRRMAYLCHQFLAVPTLFSTAPELAAALDLSPSGLTRTWRELREAGLVELVPAGTRRCYRLSRAGEDWLLAVVKGETPPA